MLLKKMLTVGLFASCCIFGSATAGKAADTCYEMKPVFVGPTVVNGKARSFVRLERTSAAQACGGLSVGGSRAYFIDPTINDQGLATALTALSLGKNVVAVIANAAQNSSLISAIYISD